MVSMASCIPSWYEQGLGQSEQHLSRVTRGGPVLVSTGSSLRASLVSIFVTDGDHQPFERFCPKRLFRGAIGPHLAGERTLGITPHSTVEVPPGVPTPHVFREQSVFDPLVYRELEITHPVFNLGPSFWRSEIPRQPHNLHHASLWSMLSLSRSLRSSEVDTQRWDRHVGGLLRTIFPLRGSTADVVARHIQPGYEHSIIRCDSCLALPRL